MSDDDVLPEMRAADDEVLTATMSILLDRRVHAASDEDRERYNTALALAGQVRDERRTLAREVADVPIPVAALVADDDNIEPLVVQAHRPPPRGNDDAALTAQLEGFRMDGLQFLEGESVPLGDLAEALRSTPEAVRADAERLGVLVGHNWQGRVSVAARDAYNLLSGAARRDQESSELNLRMQMQAEQFVAERMEVFRVAYNAVIAGRRDTPEDRERARRAGTIAGAKYERKCPEELRPWVRPLYSVAS